MSLKGPQKNLFDFTADQVIQEFWTSKDHFVWLPKWASHLQLIHYNCCHYKGARMASDYDAPINTVSPCAVSVALHQRSLWSHTLLLLCSNAYESKTHQSSEGTTKASCIFKKWPWDFKQLCLIAFFYTDDRIGILKQLFYCRSITCATFFPHSMYRQNGQTPERTRCVRFQISLFLLLVCWFYF